MGGSVSRRRHIARQYVWGCPTNSEPPDDDDDEGMLEFAEGCDEGEAIDEGPDATERDRWADAACDRYERDMDARATQ